MSLSIAIVGLPNVGKSTLFNALLKKQQALAANYPFATIEPNVGIVPVPDGRLQQLAEVIAMERVHPEGRGLNKEMGTFLKLPPIVPATVKFVDIAGLVKGASTGEGLGNKFLSHIRECDAICLVVRQFRDPDVVTTGTGVPEEDIDTIVTELKLADLETLEKQQPPKGKVTPEQLKRWEVIEKLKREEAVPAEDQELVRELGLLSLKPRIVVRNVGEQELINKSVNQIAGRDEVVINAKMESELAALSAGEQKEYLAQYGLAESGLERLIRTGYQKLKLLSFLTAGEIECRAWTIRQGKTALEASGVIHTDFMKKFIKADVIDWQEFVRLGGWKKAREAGVVRSEGRDYVMRDGLVVEFKIGA